LATVIVESRKDETVWHPCKQTLYMMFQNHHEEFTLQEWQNMHPDKYEDYISCRYVLDGCLGELTEEQQAEVKKTFYGLHPGSGRVTTV